MVPVGQARLLFKIVSVHRYLGAHLSYQGFEAQNLRHRLATAWGSYWRLHSILISRALCLKTKVRLWQACVLSVLRYSLHQVGLPSNGPQFIRQAVHRQLRMIARSPAHLWHVTSADILIRVQVEDPWIVLCRQFQAPQNPQVNSSCTPGLRSWQAVLTPTLSNTILATTSPPHNTLLACPSGSAVTPAKDGALTCASERRAHAFRVLACPHCPQQFESLGALRVHVAAQLSTSESSRPLRTRTLMPLPSLQAAQIYLCPRLPLARYRPQKHKRGDRLPPTRKRAI